MIYFTFHISHHVQLVTTFACFEKKELLRYFFSILDPNRTGLIAKVRVLNRWICVNTICNTWCLLLYLYMQTELKHFVCSMWDKQVYSNVTDGLAYLDNIDDGDGQFNFKQVEQMATRYPMTLAPLYKLQVYSNFLLKFFFCSFFPLLLV